METTVKSQGSKNPSPITSQNINGSNKNNNNGLFQIHTQIPISSTSDTTNPYPTTFVQADTSTFKQVVQILTGSSETSKQEHPHNSRNNIPPIKTIPKNKQHNSFKLYERRNNNNNNNSHHHLNNSLMINTFLPSFTSTSCNSFVTGFSPRNKSEMLSPSLLDFPKLTLSPVTPLNDDPFNKSSPYSLRNSPSEEERAIAEKGFYLHPSPISTPRDSEPQLLPLFPVTSPKVSGSSS